jgi:uncharacterized membrane protein
MFKKLFLCLALLGFLVMALSILTAPVPAYAGSRIAPIPTVTPTPFAPAKVGSNANLAIGALMLVVIILFGILVNTRHRKQPTH